MRLRPAFRIALALLVATNFLPAQTRTFLLDPRILAAIRSAASTDGNAYEKEIEALRRDARKALKVTPLTVTEKEAVPPSGDKHDYMSLAKYWWPDPSTPDGKPYVRRDGEVNPEVKNFPDAENFGRMKNAVTVLSFAYFYTGDEDCAHHAAELLRTWFLDSTTRMNPNLNFAQARPGLNDGSGSGIIDMHQMPAIIDAIGLINSSVHWTDADRNGMRKWFTDYLQWLRESKNGRKEASASNNHGVWYDVQVAAVALFIGDEAAAASVLNESKRKRIASQIEPDGSQPQELARTKSFDYTIFNLMGFVSLAQLGDRVGIDLWHYTTGDGRSIRKALDYVMPYLGGEKAWEHKQIAEVRFPDLYPVLIQASRAYHDTKYSDAASTLPGLKSGSYRFALTLGKE